MTETISTSGPAKAWTQCRSIVIGNTPQVHWVPAFAGTTGGGIGCPPAALQTRRNG